MASWLVALTVLVAVSGVAVRQEAPALRQAAPTVLSEVRIHGNYSTPDAEVLRLSGFTLGQSVDDSAIEDALERLQSSGRFEAVEIRKRYRSLSETGEVALIVVVREHPVPAGGPPVLMPIRRLAGNSLFLPILDYTDGYGLTYGARAGFANPIGRDSRVSVPLTWGGTKHAAIEVDQILSAGPFDRLQGGVAIQRRKNPHYRLDDDRREIWAGASRQLVKGLRVGLRGGLGDLTFGGLDDRFATYGADVSLDTRADPVFPRDAIFASAALEAFDPRDGPTVNRYRLEARGYKGLLGQSVLSLRWLYGSANRPLPPYERFLLGGADSLRGYRAGAFAGDNLMAASAEVRVPFSSPLGISRAGVSVFTDLGTAYDKDRTLAHARFRYGAGAGLFWLASIVQIKADFAFRQGAGTRVHVATGFEF